MRTRTVISIIALIHLDSVVLAKPASPLPGQLFYPASNPDAAAFFAAAQNSISVNETSVAGTAGNGTGLNASAPLPPYTTQECGIYAPAPLQDCINALIRFPFSSGAGNFHPWRPHDPDPEHGLNQARQSGLCRVFINLLDNTQPVEWSWDQLANYIWTMLGECTENKRAPTVEWITSGDLQIRLLDSFTPNRGFSVSVRRIQVDGDRGVDVT